MIQKGIQLTCAGCGCTTFVQTYNSELVKSLQHYKDGTDVCDYSKNQSESWSRVNTHMDLCPRCSKIYGNLLCKFYEECGKTEEDESHEHS